MRRTVPYGLSGAESIRRPTIGRKTKPRHSRRRRLLLHHQPLLEKGLQRLHVLLRRTAFRRFLRGTGPPPRGTGGWRATERGDRVRRPLTRSPRLRGGTPFREWHLVFSSALGPLYFQHLLFKGHGSLSDGSRDLQGSSQRLRRWVGPSEIRLQVMIVAQVHQVHPSSKV